ncbi:MAG: efflux RND transporter periplasmic adaptor subunit [Vicinamibacteria bacterium]|jgi:HlyD family secretion protein|nr:efflux RND transporter periplasmic adaptor subunit [Vicinamibacteria bacterium]
MSTPQLSSDRTTPATSDTSPQPRKRHTLRFWLALLITLAVLITLRLTVFAPQLIRVQVATVTRGTVEDTVANTRAGTIKARRRARLSPETGGRVVALPHREGAHVRAGDVLLRLDDAVQQAQLDLAREDVRAAGARADEVCLAAQLAKAERDRSLKLRSGGAASDQMVDRMQSERDRAEAGCRATRAVLDQARARERLVMVERAHTELRAPFNGILAELNTELGEWLSPAPPGALAPAVIELIDPSSLYVSAPIDEMDAERIRVGQEARISVDSRRGESFAGRLARIAPYVMDRIEQNRTIEIEAEFDDPRMAQSLLAGTSADVEIILKRVENVLAIPTAAVGPGHTVLIIERHRLVERPIETGLRNWRSVEVRTGLAIGERVVTLRDSPAIKAGARVSVGDKS